MPKRSNEFQKLIYLIKRQIAKNSIVYESKMLNDIRTDSSVEVDIIIETEIFGIELIVGIECTSTKRPATVEWVREMLGKHQDLPIDKTILVSKSGFSKEALKKAALSGITAITFEEAGSEDWKKCFLPDQLVNLKFDLKNVCIHCDQLHILDKQGNKMTHSISHSKPIIIESSQNCIPEKSENQIKDIKTISEFPLFIREGDAEPVRLDKFITDIIDSYPVYIEAVNKCKVIDNNISNYDIEICISPRIKAELGSLLVIATDGSKYLLRFNIKTIEINIRINPCKTGLTFEYGKFLDKNIAYAVADNIFQINDEKSKAKALFACIKEDDTPKNAWLYIPQYIDGGDKIYKMCQFDKISQSVKF